MAELEAVVSFCDERTRRREIKDFDGAYNGLQLANPGTVSRIGAAVDADQATIAKAADAGVDFLIVHHGLFWNPPIPLTGSRYAKIRQAMEAGIAIYGAHLPLDGHPEIGNNAILGQKLGLPFARSFLPYEGNDMGWIGTFGQPREQLRVKLEALFPEVCIKAVEFGSETPAEIAILTGSGMSALPYLRAAGVDTFVTGELKQHAWTLAQEDGLNLYACGHYATEVFGVQALATEAAKQFGLPWEFLATGCPL